jgi:cold-inducible RNA-binding protein
VKLPRGPGEGEAAALVGEAVRTGYRDATQRTGSTLDATTGIFRTRPGGAWYGVARLVRAAGPSWTLSHIRRAQAHSSAAAERVVPQRSSEPTVMAWKLFIGGLSFSTPTERLRELFNQIEGVESVTIVTDRDTGQSRGFGFVEVGTAEAANAAVAKLNGVQLDGRTLRVEISRPAAQRSGGPSRSGSGSGSGRGRW